MKTPKNTSKTSRAEEIARAEALQTRVRQAAKQACQILKTIKPMPLQGIGSDTDYLHPSLPEEARVAGEQARFVFIRDWLCFGIPESQILRILGVTEGASGSDRMLAEWWLGTRVCASQIIKFGEVLNPEAWAEFFLQPTSALMALQDGYCQAMLRRIVPAMSEDPSVTRRRERARRELAEFWEMVGSEDPRLAERYF